VLKVGFLESIFGSVGGGVDIFGGEWYVVAFFILGFFILMLFSQRISGENIAFFVLSFFLMIIALGLFSIPIGYIILIIIFIVIYVSFYAYRIFNQGD